jgi:hypothetical protein
MSSDGHQTYCGMKIVRADNLAVPMVYSEDLFDMYKDKHDAAAGTPTEDTP